jgi:hypothetical protein
MVGLVALAALVVVVVFTRSISGTQKAEFPVTAPQGPPSLAAVQEEQKAAETRITQLRFACIRRYICQFALAGSQSLPVYIEGMDENLERYLSRAGYTDHWTDSADTFSATTVGHAEYSTLSGSKPFLLPDNKNAVRYVEGHTGLMLENAPSTGGDGLRPPSLPGNTVSTWAVLWSLSDHSGKVVRRLSFSIKEGGCHGSKAGEATPCGHALESLREGPTHYTTAPIFQYEGKALMEREAAAPASAPLGQRADQP